MDGAPFPFGPPPPELVEEIKRQRELSHMAEEDAVARTNELIDSLDAEKLQTLRRMMMTTIGDESDTYASHTAGWIAAVLHYKHDICLACGKKHEELIVPHTETPED
jgi:hypothetical protein